MKFDNIEDVQKLVYDQLCEFINSDMDDEQNYFDFVIRVNSLMKLLKMNNVTVVSDFSPYYEFLGLANDGQFIYSKRTF